MSDNNSETSTTTNDFALLMALVTEERIVFDFSIAEKSSRTFRVTGATTWTQAAEILDEDGTHTIRVEELDGYIQHIEDYKPQREQRVMQVKIRHDWYDLNRLAVDAEWYIKNDFNIRNEIQEKMGHLFE